MKESVLFRNTMSWYSYKLVIWKYNYYNWKYNDAGVCQYTLQTKKKIKKTYQILKLFCYITLFPFK